MKRIVGLMSGTSADGIDAVLCEIEGSGDDTEARVVHMETFDYPDNIRKMLLGEPRLLPAQDVARLNFALGSLMAQAALHCIRAAGMSPEQVDAIASHGQTIVHLPDIPQDLDAALRTRATLQIGDISVIAFETGIKTVGDFRTADMAAGGQGAPLVPYADFVLFSHKTLGRVVQNIGGIGNLTYLPPNCCLEQIVAFDTGPGNMLIDALVSWGTGGTLAMDVDGRLAGLGRPNEGLLRALLSEEYFLLPPPKSTGREMFGMSYARRLMPETPGMTQELMDSVATASELTVRSIVDSYLRFVAPLGPVDQVILGGGGAKNGYIKRRITEELPRRYPRKVAVLTHDDLGIPDKGKEALAFAILANETLEGNPNNVPSATGARRRVVMGKVALP